MTPLPNNGATPEVIKEADLSECPRAGTGPRGKHKFEWPARWYEQDPKLPVRPICMVCGQTKKEQS